MTEAVLRTTTEEIWREVLKVDVDDDTDFFNQGGHSFAALRIIALLNDHYDGKASLRVLFDYPRFGDFVTALGKDLGIEA
jgi:acyl carrier protein